MTSSAANQTSADESLRGGTPAAMQIEKRSRSCVVVGPSSFGTCTAVKRAFLSLGWTADTITFDLGQRGIRNTLRKVARYAGKLSWFEHAAFNGVVSKSVLPMLRSSPPDLLVFVKPYSASSVNREALAGCRPRIVTWATDSLCRRPEQESLSSLAAHSYFMDGGDCEGSNSSWLPLGYEERTFRPVDGEKEWDILFVGNVFSRRYDSRRAFFESLRTSSLCDSHRVAFVGSLPSRIANRTGRLKGGVRWLSRGLGIEDLARVISQSRICVTIHQDDGTMPVNPMFFAIPGCGTCLVSDQRDYLASWLAPGSEYVPVTLSGFLADLKGLLNAPGRINAVAEHGLHAAMRHTYTERVRTILRAPGLGAESP